MRFLVSVSEYQCADNDCKSTTHLIGIFMNQGLEDENKFLVGSQFGVEILQPHRINFDALNASLPNCWCLVTRLWVSIAHYSILTNF